MSSGERGSSREDRPKRPRAGVAAAVALGVPVAALLAYAAVAQRSWSCESRPSQPLSSDPGPAASAPPVHRLGSPGDISSDRISNGWVLDSRARPVAGARVAVTPLSLRGLVSDPRTTVTDAKGAFSFVDLEPGAYRLEIAGDEVFGAETRWIVPGEPVRVLVTRRAAIEGFVVDGAAPAAGVRVTLSDGSYPPSHTATTDAKGRFAFTDLLPGHYEVWAHDARRASAVVPLDRTDIGPFETVELALEPAVLVAGRAIDKRSGRGVPAFVQLLSPDGRDARRTAVANDDGRFEIEGVPHGRWSVEATAPGYVTAESYALDTTGSHELTIELLSGGTVTGSVIDPEGEPVRGAAIVLRGVGGGAAPADSLLSRAQRARYLVRSRTSPAADDDLFRAVRWYHPLAGTRELPSNESRQFGAARPGPRPEECGRGHCGVDLGHVRGSIVHAAADGVVDRVVRQAQPRAGRFVRVRHDNGITTYYLHLDDIRDDLEPGAEVSAGEPIGTVGRTGVQRSGAHLHFAMSLDYRDRAWFIDPEPVLRHAIVLPRPAALDAGTGSLVAATSPEAQTLKSMRARRELSPLSALLGLPERRPKLALPPATGPDFTTDADGRFRIDGVVPGRYVAVAVHRDFANGASNPFVVELGEQAGDVEIELSPGVIVYGRITDDHDRPLGGAVVVAESAEAGHQLMDAVADDDGRYELAPLSSKVSLLVSAAGHGRAERALRLRNTTSRAIRREESFQLSAADAHLRGRVHDQDGFAIRSAKVVIVGDGAGRGRTAFTDQAGRFELDGLPAGGYRVRVEAAGYPKLTGSLSTEREGELVVPRGGGVRAEIRDAHTDDLIPGARITATGPKRARATASAANGTFELAPLAEGTWTLRADASGYVASSVKVEVRAGSDPGEITTSDVHIELARGATIAGTVRDAHGERAPGVTVEVGDVSTTSDQDGRFRLVDVPTGTVRAIAHRGDERGELELELRPGDEYVTLEISLD